MKGPILTPWYAYLIGPVIMWFLGLVLTFLMSSFMNRGVCKFCMSMSFPPKSWGNLLVIILFPFVCLLVRHVQCCKVWPGPSPFYAGLSEPSGMGGIRRGHCAPPAPPKILADTLTLFELGRQIMNHHSCTPNPPGFSDLPTALICSVLSRQPGWSQ